MAAGGSFRACRDHWASHLEELHEPADLEEALHGTSGVTDDEEGAAGCPYPFARAHEQSDARRIEERDSRHVDPKDRRAGHRGLREAFAELRRSGEVEFAGELHFCEPVRHSYFDAEFPPQIFRDRHVAQVFAIGRMRKASPRIGDPFEQTSCAETVPGAIGGGNGLRRPNRETTRSGDLRIGRPEGPPALVCVGDLVPADRLRDWRSPRDASEVATPLRSISIMDCGNVVRL